jgi:hypothetical protein
MKFSGMRWGLCAVLAAMVLGLVGQAHAADYLWIFGVDRLGYSPNATGAPPSFMCIGSGDPRDRTGTNCFAFYPRTDSLQGVRLSDGGALVRQGDDWIETPGGYRFHTIGMAPDQLSLFDSSRQIGWSLSLTPNGGSTLALQGRSGPFYRVTGFMFGPSPVGFVATSGGSASPLKYAAVSQGPNVETFTRRIPSEDVRRIYDVITAWNRRGAPLTDASALELLDDVVTAAGARMPEHRGPMSGAAYVRALSRVNGFKLRLRP